MNNKGMGVVELLILIVAIIVIVNAVGLIR